MSLTGTGGAVSRALLSLGVGLVAFLGVVALIAPPAVAGEALVLGGAAIVPGVVVLAFTARARRSRQLHVDEED